jgi:hypothetical protein
VLGIRTRLLAGAAALGCLTLAVGAAAPDAAPAPDRAVAADMDHLKKLFELSKTKKKLEGRVKATAMLIAGYAQDNLGGKDGDKYAGLRAGALKVAEAAAKKDLAAAETAVGEMATAKGDKKPLELATMNKIDLHDIMHLFGGSVGGGMNLEKDIRAAKKDGVKDVKAAEVIGLRVAKISDYTLALPPELGGKKTKADWDKWTNLMKTQSIELAAEAAKGDKADLAKLKKSMNALDATCTNCHNTFRDD